MQRQREYLFTLALCVAAALTGSANAQTTAFTYQGRLADGGVVANATYDMQFKLFDAAASGNQIGATLTNATVQVANGIFTVPLDFGAASFPGADRFIEVSVRPAGSVTAYTTLTPRQKVTSTPYAVQALNAITATTAANLTTAGSANFIQNTTTQQAASNFNISGNGIVGGTLTASSVNATTQYNLGGTRILSNAGTNNLFAGVNAGAANTTQTDNTFIGAGAGQNNGAGDTHNQALHNTFVGSQAGSANTTGRQNSFFGARAGLSNLSDDNSFFGSSAGTANTIGFANSFFGSGAGPLNTQGFSNSFFGSTAGDNNTTGNKNSFFGEGAGNNNTTGSNNTLIGASADVQAGSNLNFATAIGAGAFVTTSNSIVLGRTTGATLDNVGIGFQAPTFKLHVVDAGNTGLRVQTNSSGGTVASFGGNGDFQVDSNGVVGGRFIVQQAGNVGIGTATPQARLDVNGIIRVASFGSAGSTQICLNASNQISSCGSSLRYKTNIAAFATGMQLIKQLQPITFDWKQSGIHDVGFGAEDVAQLNRLFVTYNQGGQIEGVKYDRFATLFVNAFKEQQEQIETQEQFINSQQSAIEEQQAALQTQHEQSAASAQKLKTQLESQQIQLARHQRMIHELRTLVCRTNRQAPACRKN